MPKTLRDDRQGDLFAMQAPPPIAAPAPCVDPTKRIEHAALLDRLALGPRADITVVTPSLRLAQALEAQVDSLQAARGCAFWEASDIVAFGPFNRRCHEAALFCPAVTRLPALLSDAAERLVWEEAIRASPWRDAVLSVPATAALAAEAWALAHSWRIAGALRMEPCGIDAEAFAHWADDYRRRTERANLIDGARLPALVGELLGDGALEAPRTLVAYAFERITPQQSDFLEACRRAGTEVVLCDAPAVPAWLSRVELEHPRAELEQAARWARSRLEAASPGRLPRIGVVVPDLAKRRREAQRVFARVLAPNEPFAGHDRAPLFDISMGEPLSAWPLVDAALAVIAIALGPVTFDRASRLLRSPFIAGSEAELAARARLDAALRRAAPASVSLVALRKMFSHVSRRYAAPACPRLDRALDGLIEAAKESARAAPLEWARRFTRMLDAVGYPGERALDSSEHQALRKWRDLLGELATLTPVAGEWNAAEALARLQRLCGETLFQPKVAQAPVQVVGLLESVGLAFDHLWVSGLEEGAWPIAARPHPLIAASLQRRAGIPQASPEAAFRVDEAITHGWRGAAAEVVFSSARADGDREMVPSPLVADVALAALESLSIPAYPLMREVLFAVRRDAMSRRVDDIGPPVAKGPAPGGTRILVDQAACAFRAFAHFRLDARSLEAPQPGLDAMDRGQLLHVMMARLWEGLKDSATLAATDEATLAVLIGEAVDAALARVHDDRPGRLEGPFAEMERERLAQIAREWLALEATRPPFEVRLREASMPLSAGRLQIDGRIDRIDRLEGGGLAIIDYKSGNVRVGAWMGERPDDPQLPLYALAAGQGDVRAVAYARLKAGDRGFSGVSRDADAIPGVPAVDKYRGVGAPATWEELMAQWRIEVDRLGEGFANGDARVDPKQLLATCRWCDLKPLCRVHERLSPLDEGDEDEDREESA
ncbi:MAG TPA: PD-(D/E)XK nuclease family protein [Usitatibacter sp.]|nr:PD-(D/E)XK nuclease family protein [Usitatibacter sp.]